MVFDAIHSGQAEFMGFTSWNEFPIYNFNGVTGTDINVGLGVTGQPTNTFMFKGTASPSIVPIALQP